MSSNGGNGNGNGNGGNGHEVYHLYDALAAAGPPEEPEEEGVEDRLPPHEMEEDHLDCQGRKRHFRLSEYGSVGYGWLRAMEVLPGGDPGWEIRLPFAPERELPPYGVVRTKIREHLARRDLVRDKSTGRLEVLTDLIRAQVSMSPEGEGPDLIIDGEIVRWAELGRILSSFEGWGLRIVITEPGEE